MPLSKEQEERYTPLIDEILAASDLTTISTKKVRVALQEKTGDDFSDELKVSCSSSWFPCVMVVLLVAVGVAAMSMSYQ
jgi:hypothetical protein